MEFFRSLLADAGMIAGTGVNHVTYKTIEGPTTWNLQGKGIPILLIHGSGANQLEWGDFFKSKAKWNVHDNPVYAYTMDLPFKDGVQVGGRTPISTQLGSDNGNTKIEHYAERVTQYIEHIKIVHSVSKVILIGHSMGGLVARYCDTVLNLGHSIEKVITIASPHRGAPLLGNDVIATVLSTARNQQMTPGSTFLTDSQFTVREPWKYLTFGSVCDTHVPNDYATIDGVRHIIIEGCGHFGIVDSERLWFEIYKFIGQDVTAPASYILEDLKEPTIS